MTPHRKELVHRVRAAVDRERDVRAKQLAYGGWVEQVAYARAETDAAIAALRPEGRGEPWLTPPTTPRTQRRYQ